MAKQESLFIPWPESEASGRLHARHIFPESDRLGSPVLLVHGAIENGRIFYSESGRGLAPFLARYGFDTYVADLRGRGLSEPRVGPDSKYGQFESITQEIPAFAELIRSRRGDEQQIWMAHSWGGVLMLSTLARFPELRRLVKGMVFFGTKRSVHVSNWEKKLKIDWFWNSSARALVKLYGYLPAAKLGVGSDNESELSHLESVKWVKPGPWIDPRDGFDYEKALTRAELPPMLFLAGRKDRCLGHPQDVRCLIRELGPQEVEFRLLGRGTGARHDYGHIDMMTHPEAAEDHFLDVLKWVRTQLPSAR
jgi:pimeloyl-ACP methyl ester carboxylesterase